MRWTRPFVVGALSASLLGPALGLITTLVPARADAAVVERVVAVVGERAILLSEVRERSRAFLLRVYDSVPAGPQRDAAISQVYRAVLGKMVEEELEDAAAAKAGIVVTAREIDQALTRVAAQNGLTTNVILAEAKRSGLTEEQYRSELRRQLLQAKLANVRLQGRIRVTESDLKSAYRKLLLEERQRLQQRLVGLVLDAGSTEEEQRASRALAASIVERARAGEDFRALVQQYSLVPYDRALQPPRPPLQEAEPVRRATILLEVGEVSQPILHGNHLVIFLLAEREESTLPDFEEARPALHERVYMEKMGTARQHWLDGLKNRTHVDMRL
ncbi:MAG: peptidylprolyl isomerase [Myxococcales bacterium]|jgi:peptidyl-prolyl cis-trans isomerase SurA|nr:peptidylprolyl isomerase [Myxococcales bacterium]